MSQWVQHKLRHPDGPMYKLRPDISSTDDDSRWYAVDAQDRSVVLPKHEYRLCPPPQVWVDVTDKCEIIDQKLVHDGADIHTAQWYHNGKYRFVKSKCYGATHFHIEKLLEE